jgi:hypothetical protein
MAERSADHELYDNHGGIVLTGSSNAYVATVARSVGGYHQELRICAKANHTNTGASTLNLVTPNSPSGIGAVAIRKAGNAALVGGEIVSGKYYDFLYDATNSVFQLQNPDIGTGTISTALIADDAVTNAKLANMAESTIKGRAAGAGTGDPTDLTATQATAILNPFTDALKGLVPASGGGTTTFLRADATFAAPSTGPTPATEQATTSGTEFDFTGIPASVNRIHVIFNGVSLSGTDDILVQIGDAGGIETTGYLSTSCDPAGPSFSSSTAGFISRSSSAATVTIGVMTLTRVNSLTWIANHSARLSATNVSVGGGSKTLSDTLTQVRITRTGTNTFDLGSVNILYD